LLVTRELSILLHNSSSLSMVYSSKRFVCYVFTGFCNVCLEYHPRKTTYYLCPPFIGPKLPSIPPWLTPEYIPFPTIYWKNTHYDDRSQSLDPNWGPKDHGYFLQPLLNSFAEENLTPPWHITFRFESCDGEWILRIIQREIEVYVNIALSLCRASRDAYSAIKL
jgi:hypothetical protein